VVTDSRREIPGAVHWWSLIRREEVSRASMNGNIPTRDIPPEGDPPASGDVPQLGSP
jgi:hypothetical protein